MADVPTLDALLDAFNAHDLDHVMSLFTEDCVLEMPRGPDPWGTRCVGPEAVRDALAGRFSGIPDVHYGQAEHWICGQRAVSTWRLTGTTSSGEPVDVHGCDLFDLDPAGLVRRKDSYWKIVT